VPYQISSRLLLIYTWANCYVLTAGPITVIFSRPIVGSERWNCSSF